MHCLAVCPAINEMRAPRANLVIMPEFDAPQNHNSLKITEEETTNATEDVAATFDHENIDSQNIEQVVAIYLPDYKEHTDSEDNEQINQIIEGEGC